MLSHKIGFGMSELGLTRTVQWPPTTMTLSIVFDCVTFCLSSGFRFFHTSPVKGVRRICYRTHSAAQTRANALMAPGQIRL